MRKNNKMAYKIKPVDKRILQLIEDKGLCVPQVTKIAHLVGLPTSTVHSKLKKMSEAGIIKGYSIDLDPKSLDKDFVAFLLGQIPMNKKDEFDIPGEEISKIPQVQEVYFVTGEWDYIVKIRVRNKEEYYEVMQKVSKCFGFRASGMVCPKCFKDTSKFLID